MSEPATATTWRRPSLRFVLAFAAVMAAQLWVLRYFGGAELFEPRPVAGLDFDTHIHQTWRMVEGLHTWRRHWVWDPRLVAGYPTGTIFEADNIGWATWTWLLTEVGVSQPLAFNLFVVFAHVGLVPAIYLAARWLDLQRNAALLAAAAAVLLWAFDSWLHWCWYVGMLAYATASWMCLLPLALFLRWWQRRGVARGAGVALLMGVCHLVHPYSFLLLVTPLAVVYVRGARELDRRGHLAVWGMAIFTVAMNLWWLRVAAQWWSYILDSSLFGDRSLAAVLYDLFNLLDDPAVTGIVATRATIRITWIVLGTLGVVAWWRRGDAKALPIGLTMIVLALIAYFGGGTPLSHVQPYRHVAPLGLLATIPAASWVHAQWRAKSWRSWPIAARRTAAVLGIGTTLWIAQDVLYFTARSLPDVRPLPHGEKVWFSALGHVAPVDYSYANWHRDDVAKWVSAHDDGQGRWLVDGWSWGEQLAWKTDAQIMGGFIWRNLEHSWANILRRRPQGIIPAAELEAYAKTYGIRWVVVSSSREVTPWWDKNEALQRVAELPPFRFYKVKAATHLLEPPRGTLEVTTNRIVVRGTDPKGDVLVKFHPAPTLHCEPGCEMVPVAVEGDPVGFFRVPAPHPADFAIVQRY
ncbi:MAG: hypothetical protein IPK74_06260 [Deltaproteobacteria bacterium]|nr:hypothetical protein [Deltaproteobacteria bacterium]